AEVAKPAGPPPNWLKPYMTEQDKPQQYRDSDEQKSAGPAIDQRRPPQAPSDRAQGPFFLEPEDASPSDRDNATGEDFQIRDYQRDSLERAPVRRGRDDKEMLPAPQDLSPDSANRANDYSRRPAAQVPVRRIEQPQPAPSQQRIETELLSPQPLESQELVPGGQPAEEDELLLGDEDLSVRRRYQRAPKTARGPDGSHVSVLERTPQSPGSLHSVFENPAAAIQPTGTRYVPTGYNTGLQTRQQPQYPQPRSAIPPRSTAHIQASSRPVSSVRADVNGRSYHGMPVGYRNASTSPLQTAHPAMVRRPSSPQAGTQPQLNWQRSAQINSASSNR
ncbi:MAG TPA: hypothetical protein DDW52_08330, partial [Planctomycetaceae bacterium]|nr:hypothetical protein [Planctomycetaceae bacterium]